MSAWYTAPLFGIPRGGSQTPSSACPRRAATCLTGTVPVNTGLGSSQGPSTARSDGYAWKQSLTWLAAAASTSTLAATAAARRGQDRSSGCRATASSSPASAALDHSTTENGSKSGNGRHTLLISHVTSAMTPAAATTISGTHTTSQRTDGAPPAPPPRPPRRSQPRPRAFPPATSHPNASSAPASKITGSGPASSDQSSGFIAPRPPPPEHPRVSGPI